MAKLYFYYATMNSGKSLRLLTSAYNFEENSIPFLIMKSSKDTRGSQEYITSRVGLKRECILIEEEDDIYESVKNCIKNTPIDWILVDECQFLEEGQIDDLSKIVDLLDINVMCFGLRTDFQSKLFPGSKRLFELADDIEEIKSTCKCGKKTSINARIDENGEIITDGDQIMVGGNEMYRTMCRKCWNKLIQNKQNNVVNN
ncbi:MAG: thymidine kinase [Bacilli bacterium]|nr:thymidine kinase [Bacilli bacterium]